MKDIQGASIIGWYIVLEVPSLSVSTKYNLKDESYISVIKDNLCGEEVWNMVRKRRHLCKPLGKIPVIMVHFYTLFKDARITHWGRVTHLCVSKINIIGLDYVLSPGRRQAIIGTSAEIVLILALKQTSVKSEAIFTCFLPRKCNWKYLLRNDGHFVSAPKC